jgi:putative copper export protein
MAAVIWVGGSMFFVLVIRPQQWRAGGQVMGPEALNQFRGLVDTCMAVLLVTGTILLFDRMTDASTTTIYIVTVSIKIGLALWMFSIARRRWQRRRSNQTQLTSPSVPRRGLLARAMGLMSGINLTVILGIAVFFLSDLLAFIFQEGLTGR